MKDEYLGVKLFKARKLIDKFSSQLMLFKLMLAHCAKTWVKGCRLWAPVGRPHWSKGLIY